LCPNRTIPLALASSGLTRAESPFPAREEATTVSTHMAHREQRRVSTRGAEESVEWRCKDEDAEDDEDEEVEDEEEKDEESEDIDVRWEEVCGLGWGCGRCKREEGFEGER